MQWSYDISWNHIPRPGLQHWACMGPKTNLLKKNRFICLRGFVGEGETQPIYQLMHNANLEATIQGLCYKKQKKDIVVRTKLQPQDEKRRPNSWITGISIDRHPYWLNNARITISKWLDHSLEYFVPPYATLRTTYRSNGWPYEYPAKNLILLFSLTNHTMINTIP